MLAISYVIKMLKKKTFFLSPGISIRLNLKRVQLTNNICFEQFGECRCYVFIKCQSTISIWEFNVEHRKKQYTEIAKNFLD